MWIDKVYKLRVHVLFAEIAILQYENTFCKHVRRWVTNNAHKIDKVELILYAVDLSKGEEVTCKHRLVCVDVGL